MGAGRVWGGRAAASIALAVAAAACALPASASALDAHGSARQVYATGAPPAAKVQLLNRFGRQVKKKKSDSLGGVLFRNVRPGVGYKVRVGRHGAQSGPLTVFSERAQPPSTSVYDQQIPSSGYGYMTTRDGTKLALYVHPPQDVAKAFPLPGGVTLPSSPPNGPTPTLIEYSGYGYANPAGPTNGISILANLMGFTVVDVNMRGTGCSGGAFDFFEPLQNLDGYDVVETVARQSWVQDHKVGMMGISYGGISQLFTAQLRPPSLEAIAPLSVLDQTLTTLYPGGVLNTGFAVDWAKERIHEAKPASSKEGQAWAYKRIQEGDQTCKENQVLHGQAADLMKKIRSNNHYRPKIADPLAPNTFVHKINVPVYVACQWTDEQTGGHCADIASRFTGTRRKWFTFTNGTHVDSLSPDAFNRWYDFLMLYVAHKAPSTNSATMQAGAPVIYQEAMGISGVTLPPDPIQEQPTYDGALAAFEQLPSIRILFDNGAGGKNPGEPHPGFEQSWPSFPIPGTTARSWYLGRGGALTDAKPAKRGVDSFTWDSHARPRTDFSGDTAGGENGLWTATPPYKWLSPPAGSAASYVTSPLATDTTVIGPGSVRAWVRSAAKKMDLQVTVSEVRPDGKETFVQGGWLRGNGRKLDRRQSTLLEPVPTFRKRDDKPFPRKRFVKLAIPLYYEGHAYRAGSRIRITISAPNGDQPIWAFDETRPGHRTEVAIAYSKKRPSRLVLPVIPNVAVPTDLPPCPGLRGEPCRDYQPYRNTTK
jgi:predicted acyl esterase